MFIAKVVGSVVSTQKAETMVGHKLLLIEPYRINAETRTEMVTTGRTLVAVDTMGAGENEYVLVVQGSSARMTPETKSLPVDAVIVGIVDSVRVGKNNINL
jgi:ethanolamine utilization protein EutN